MRTFILLCLSVSPCLRGASSVVHAAPAGYGVSPRLAIERAVAERLGPGVSVTVSSLSTTVPPTPGLEAVPDPAARSGRPVRFTLVTSRGRLGTAVATVRVRAPHARAAHAIARDEAIGPEDVVVVEDEVPGVPFRHLPSVDEVTGLQARRDIAPGEAITDAVVVVPPLVRSGEPVTVTVRFGRVQAQGTAIASGSGHLGDTIHIRQRARRRTLTARIIGAGAVELLP